MQDKFSNLFEKTSKEKILRKYGTEEASGERIVLIKGGKLYIITIYDHLLTIY